MDLGIKLFNPRRVICEAVKITEENYQQSGLSGSPVTGMSNRAFVRRLSLIVVRSGQQVFGFMTEGSAL